MSGSGDEPAADEHLVARRVETHLADLDDVLRRTGGAVARRRAPHRGPDPRDELAEAERLGHVVVGADLEPDDGVDLGVPRGDHDDRDLRPRPDLAADVDSRHLRQHDVEQHERGPDRIELRHRLGTVGRGLHDEALALQRDRQGITVRRLVVDDENGRRISHHASSDLGRDAGEDTRGGTVGPVRAVREREDEPERRSLALDRIDRDLAAVGLRDVAHDRETEAGPAGRAAAGLVDPVEAFEDPLEVAAKECRCPRRARR